jgi:hypothetical protein
MLSRDQTTSRTGHWDLTHDLGFSYSDDNLVRMGEGGEPVDLGLNFLRRAGVGEIAGMDEDITGGDGLRDEGVGVGETDDGDVAADGVMGTEKGEEEVEESCDELDGGQELELE